LNFRQAPNTFDKVFAGNYQRTFKIRKEKYGSWENFYKVLVAIEDE